MLGMLDISTVVSFAKVVCHTDIVCKKTFSSSLVIIHPTDVHFKKSSQVISITLNDDKDSIQTKSKVNKEDKSSLRMKLSYKTVCYTFLNYKFFHGGCNWQNAVDHVT